MIADDDDDDDDDDDADSDVHDASARQAFNVLL